MNTVHQIWSLNRRRQMRLLVAIAILFTNWTTPAEASFLKALLQKPSGPYKLAVCQATLLNQDFSREGNAHLFSLRDLIYRVAKSNNLVASQVGSGYHNVTAIVDGEPTMDIANTVLSQLNQIEIDTESPASSVRWMVSEVRGKEKILQVMEALKADTIEQHNAIEASVVETRKNLKGKFYSWATSLSMAALWWSSLIVAGNFDILHFANIGIATFMALIMAKLITTDRLSAHSVHFPLVLDRARESVESDSNDYFFMNSTFLYVTSATIDELNNNRDQELPPQINNIVANSLGNQITAAETFEVMMKSKKNNSSSEGVKPVVLVADHFIYYDDQDQEPVWLVYHRVVDPGRIQSINKKPKDTDEAKENKSLDWDLLPTPVRARQSN